MNTNSYKYTGSERTTNKIFTCHSKERKGYWQSAEKGPKDLIIFFTKILICKQMVSLVSTKVSSILNSTKFIWRCGWVSLLLCQSLQSIICLKRQVRTKAISKFESKCWIGSTVGIQGWVLGEKYFSVYVVINKRPVSRLKNKALKQSWTIPKLQWWPAVDKKHFCYYRSCQLS